MKKIRLKALWILLLLGSHTFLQAKTSPLTVYVYDSFVGDSTLGEVIQKLALEKLGVKTEFVSFSSAGEALNQILIEGDKTKADLLIGIDESLLSRAWESHRFQILPDTVYKSVPSEHHFDPKKQFVPFDYGYLTLVYDSQKVKDLDNPISWDHFLRQKSFWNQVAIQDPRTSSIGFSFLLWTLSLRGDQWPDFWKEFRPFIAVTAPGWSGAYGLFLKGEVQFVVSYTTSPAYHIEKEKNSNIKALVFNGGHIRQTEGIGLVKTSKQPELAKKWISLLLSKKVQSELPTKQWMYPVNPQVKLPKSFEALAKVKSVKNPDSKLISTKRQEWLRNWTQIVSEVK